MQPREARRAWRADIKRRKVAGLFVPDLWVVEYAPLRGKYAEHHRGHRAVDALRAFADLEVRDGEKKRLLRNGNLIDRVIAPRVCAYCGDTHVPGLEYAECEAVLPIAI